MYLRVVEELSTVNIHLVALPQLDMTKINPAEGFQGFLSSAAKLQLVAEPKTALLVNDLVADFGELIVQSIARSIPLQNIRTNIEVANDLYEGAITEERRILSEMAKITESGQGNEAAYRALQMSFDFQLRQAEKYAAERCEHQGKFLLENKEFSINVFLELRLRLIFKTVRSSLKFYTFFSHGLLV